MLLSCSICNVSYIRFSGNQFADFIAAGRKLFLVLCHDVPRIQFRIVVQVEGVRQKLPSGFPDFSQGEPEQINIVCLELNCPFGLQYRFISFQKLPGSQPSVGVPVLRPWI